MSITKRIETLILDNNVSDDDIKKEIEGIDSLELSKEDQNKIIYLIKEKRSTLFSKWQLEIASSYI